MPEPTKDIAEERWRAIHHTDDYPEVVEFDSYRTIASSVDTEVAATLIAQAPRMLAALEALWPIVPELVEKLASLDEEGPWMADALRIEGAVVDAKNVIAAARGGA